MTLNCNHGELMALNDTSSLALLASFPDLSDERRKALWAGLSQQGRKVAIEIERLQKFDGFVLRGASSPRQVAQLYLDWARGATAQRPVRTRSRVGAQPSV